MESATISSADRPWLAVYPAGTPPTIEAAPYRLLGDIARERAALTPEKTAFTCVMPNGMAGSLHLREVDALSDAFAAYLREELRLAAGDRVAIQIPNGLAYPVVAFGTFKAGCVLVNVNPLYTADEMAKIYEDADPAVLVIIDMFADKLAAALEQTKVPTIILTSAAELFPTLRRAPSSASCRSM